MVFLILRTYKLGNKSEGSADKLISISNYSYL